jgi:hypothetical protein
MILPDSDERLPGDNAEHGTEGKKRHLKRNTVREMEE